MYKSSQILAEALMDNKGLPNSLEAERAILGSILIDPSSTGLLSIIDKLKVEDFSIFSNQVIYGIYVDLYNGHVPIDPTTLKVALEQKKLDDSDKHGDVLNRIGGMAYIASLMDGAIRVNNLEEYAKIVKSKSQFRELIKEAYLTIQDCYTSNNPNELISSLINKLLTIVTNTRDDKDHCILAGLLNQVDRVKALTDNPLLFGGINTGFIELDKKIKGLRDSDLIIIGARPSVGKTAFALQLARNVSLLTNKLVALFSLEMDEDSVDLRFLASEARVDSNRFMDGSLSRDEWLRVVRATNILADAPILRDDTANISTLDIKIRLMNWLAKYNKKISLLIIDYLQLMKPTVSRKTDNRRQDVSQVTRDLKMLAKELKIPVVAISSLSRSSEGRVDHRPQLSDLKESGEIESDADVVMFLYREEMYEPKPENYGLAELIIAKNRKGPTGTIRLGFIKEYTKFANLWYGNTNHTSSNHTRTNNPDTQDYQFTD